MKLLTRESRRNVDSCYSELSWIEIDGEKYPIYGDLPWSDERLQEIFTEADFRDNLGPQVSGFIVRHKRLYPIRRLP